MQQPEAEFPNSLWSEEAHFSMETAPEDFAVLTNQCFLESQFCEQDVFSSGYITDLSYLGFNKSSNHMDEINSNNDAGTGIRIRTRQRQSNQKNDGSIFQGTALRRIKLKHKIHVPIACTAAGPEGYMLEEYESKPIDREVGSF